MFEGFRIAYVESDEEKMASNLLVKGLDQDSVLTKEALEEKQHFYTAAGTLYRSSTGKDTGRTGDWTAEYVCTDNLYNHRKTICFERK